MESKLLLCKIKRWFSLWLRNTFREILAPVMDSGALVQILPILFAIYLIFLADGSKEMESKVLNIWAAQQTLIAVIPVFVIICMIRSIFLVSKQLGESGKWYGSTFIYNKSQLVFTATVAFDDNDKVHVFKVNDAEVDSLVTLGFEIDRRDDRVKAQVTESHGKCHVDWRGATPIIRTGLRLPKDKKLALRTHSEAQTDPTKIRVYAHRWEVLPNVTPI